MSDFRENQVFQDNLVSQDLLVQKVIEESQELRNLVTKEREEMLVYWDLMVFMVQKACEVIRDMQEDQEFPVLKGKEE